MNTSVKIPTASLADATTQQLVVKAIAQQFSHLSNKEVAAKSTASSRQVRRVKGMDIRLNYSEGYIILPLEMLQRMSPLEALLAIEFAELETTFGNAIISNKKLAAKYHTSVFSIKRAKRELRKKNYLTQKKRFSKGWQLANHYHVTVNAFGKAFYAVASTIKFFAKKKWTKKATENAKLNAWLNDTAQMMLVEAKLSRIAA